MTPAARLSAAIEVLGDIAARRRPAADALKDWGLAHRFAGSKDRAAIASLVYDALRRRASAALVMGSEQSTRPPRAPAPRRARLARGMAGEPSPSCATARASPPRSRQRARELQADPAALADAPAHVAGDFPEWLGASSPPSSATTSSRRCERSPGAHRSTCASTRSRERATRPLAALAHLHPEPTPHSPSGCACRMARMGADPSVQSEPAFLDGLVEIQDEGSQLVAKLAGARPGETVIDLCAGGGGKTLALAASMDNGGRIVATDADQRRLAPIHARLARPGHRCRGPHAARASRRAARRSRRGGRSRARRCALHRRRRLAAQPRCQMARKAGQPRPAQKDQDAVLDRAVALREAARAHRLHHLLGPSRGERCARQGLS